MVLTTNVFLFEPAGSVVPDECKGEPKFKTNVTPVVTNEATNRAGEPHLVHTNDDTGNTAAKAKGTGKTQRVRLAVLVAPVFVVEFVVVPHKMFQSK